MSPPTSHPVLSFSLSTLFLYSDFFFFLRACVRASRAQLLRIVPALFLELRSGLNGAVETCLFRLHVVVSAIPFGVSGGVGRSLLVAGLVVCDPGFRGGCGGCDSVRGMRSGSSGFCLGKRRG